MHTDSTVSPLVQTHLRCPKWQNKANKRGGSSKPPWVFKICHFPHAGPRHVDVCHIWWSRHVPEQHICLCVYVSVCPYSCLCTYSRSKKEMFTVLSSTWSFKSVLGVTECSVLALDFSLSQLFMGLQWLVCVCVFISIQNLSKYAGVMLICIHHPLAGNIQKVQQTRICQCSTCPVLISCIPLYSK